MNCPNCHKQGAHYVGPSFGEAGLYICEAMSDEHVIQDLVQEIATVTDQRDEAQRERQRIHGLLTQALVTNDSNPKKFEKQEKLFELP